VLPLSDTGPSLPRVTERDGYEALNRPLNADVLDIGPLRSLIAIADSGGFHRAASALHLSQSAVSQHVRKLETVVGAPLLERDGRNARFTALGEALLTEARQIVGAHDRAVTRLARDQPRQVTVGTTEHAADLILPPIISTLGHAFPDVQVNFRFDRAKALNLAVDQGRIDIAVFVSESSSGVGTHVGSLPLRWCAASAFVLPPAGAMLPLVAIESPCAIRNTALEILADNGIRAKVVGDAAYLAGALNAARAGLGVALFAFSGPPPEGLVEVPELPPAPPVTLAARVRDGADESITTTVMDVLRATLAATVSPSAVFPSGTGRVTMRSGQAPAPTRPLAPSRR
jgi:DNA-binding transcriptional LysR family regulator